MDTLLEKMARVTASTTDRAASRRGFMKLVGKASLALGAAAAVAAAPQAANAFDDGPAIEEPMVEAAVADLCCNITRLGECQRGCRTKSCSQACTWTWCWRC